MNFEKYLMEKYPKLFYSKENGELQCPCGVWVPSGWEKIVDDLCGCMIHHVNNTKIYSDGKYSYPPQVKIDQIKEKFSDLRVYISGGDERIHGMISFAKYLCNKTCQNTGDIGIKCQRNGWYATLSESEIKRLEFSIL